MDQNRRSRAFTPQLEGAEPRIYLSGAAGKASILPKTGLIDVRLPNIVTDLRDSLLRTTPHDGRQGWAVNLLCVDTSTRMVYGGLTLLYRAKSFPSFFSSNSNSNSYSYREKLKVNIAWATPLDAPKVGDVKVAVSRVNSNFGPNVRREMAIGVIQFLQADRSLIAAQIPNSITLS